EFPYFVDYVRRYIIAHHGEDALYKGGLRVQTTLDPRLQLLAQQTLADQLAGTKPPLEMSIVAVEPPTGFVKALVGGRDFSAATGQVNLALGKCYTRPPARPPTDQPVCLDGGGTGRQPGSSFKPFTLAKALEKGISPEKVYRAPSSYRICPGSQPGCVVRGGGSGGSSTLRNATWRSINTVYVQVIQDAGVKDTAELAHRRRVVRGFHADAVDRGLDGLLRCAPPALAYQGGLARGRRHDPRPHVEGLHVAGDGGRARDRLRQAGPHRAHCRRAQATGEAGLRPRREARATRATGGRSLRGGPAQATRDASGYRRASGTRRVRGARALTRVSVGRRGRWVGRS